MPTYQYACMACGHQLEAVQAFSDAPLTSCPECDGRLRKVFSSVGIVFKGSGFYRTDSRSGTSGEGTSSKSDTSASSSSSSTSSGSSTSSTSSGGSDAKSGSTSGTAAKKSAAPVAS